VRASSNQIVVITVFFWVLSPVVAILVLKGSGPVQANRAGPTRAPRRHPAADRWRDARQVHKPCAWSVGRDRRAVVGLLVRWLMVLCGATMTLTSGSLRLGSPRV